MGGGGILHLWFCSQETCWYGVLVQQVQHTFLRLHMQQFYHITAMDQNVWLGTR